MRAQARTFYFCYADDGVELEPLSASPLLQRVGIKRRSEEGNAVGRGLEEGKIKEEPHGTRVKHYN